MRKLFALTIEYRQARYRCAQTRTREGDERGRNLSKMIGNLASSLPLRSNEDERGDLSKMIGNLASSLPLRSNEDERGGTREGGIFPKWLAILHPRYRYAQTRTREGSCIAIFRKYYILIFRKYYILNCRFWYIVIFRLQQVGLIGLGWRKEEHFTNPNQVGAV